MKFPRKQPMIHRSHPLVGFGRILLLHPIVLPRLNYAFQEWRETQHLSTPTFSWIQHAILHWKKATYQSFILMAQALVRLSQWPSFKPTFKWKVHYQLPWHQFRMGGMSLKIEHRTFIGARIVTPWRRSIFITLQWRGRNITTTCRWMSIFGLFYCSDYNSFS